MRKYMIGILIGAALMFSAQVGAATLKGSKVSGTMTVNLNGKQVGQAAVIDGTSYLPVRAMSNSLNLGVSVEGGAVNLTTPDPSQLAKDEQAQFDREAKINDLNLQKKNTEDQITDYQSLIDRAKEAIARVDTSGELSEPDKEFLATWQNGLAVNQQKLADAQARLADIEKQLAELAAQ